jgi:hypothetical protein
MRRTAFAFILIVAVSLAACQPAPGPSGNGAGNGYPGPAENGATHGTPISDVPAPSANLATVTGYLMVDPGAPKPVEHVILYLGEIIPETGGTPFVAGFERTTSPRTLTDANGRFVFTDVEPGPYTLILDKIAESYMLGDPDNPGGDFIFDAQPGQILDLGQLVYLRMP